jgi:hypothetical protein
MRPGRRGFALAVVSALVAAAATAAPGPAWRADQTARLRELVAGATQEQQLALRTLSAGPASRARRYTVALAHVDAALADVDALKAELAAAARQGQLPTNDEKLNWLLNSAFGGDNQASVQVGEALWLLGKHVPVDDTFAAKARRALQAASVATRALAQLLAQ